MLTLPFPPSLLHTQATFQQVGLTPRGFALSPNGETLVLAHKDANTEQIWVMSVNPSTGALNLVSKASIDGHPLMVTFAAAQQVANGASE